DIEPGIGVDVAQMIVHFLDAGSILRGDDSGLPGPFVHDDAPEVHHAVVDRDLQTERTPIRRIERAHDAVVDVLVVRRGVGNLVSDGRYCPQQIGTCNKAYEPPVAHHRQPLDALLLHQPNQL
ncbi:hypothetical protein NS44R_14655, partial [Mammaliicoccus sciuri]